MNPKDLASYLDFANHHPDATPEIIRDLCQKVKKYGFHTAFVNPCFLSLAKEALEGEGKLGTVVSFPLGGEKKDFKVLASLEAVKSGADELDVSMNVGLFKGGQETLVLEEMKAIVSSVKNYKQSVLVKFIIETGLLNEEEIKKASQLVLSSGADFVKTCSGYGPRGATLSDVLLIREAVGNKIKLKVAGGIDTREEAEAFIKAGVDRIGTSKAVEIIQGKKGEGNGE